MMQTRFIERIFSLLAGALCLTGALDARADEDPSLEIRFFSDCPTCPDMVVVPAGSFVMGTAVGGYEQPESTGESPPVAIEVSQPFAIGVAEITRREFLTFAEDTNREARIECRVWRAGRWDMASDVSWKEPIQPGSPTDVHPINCVSWDDARDYAQWLSDQTGNDYRLPSEAEWEYAARGGTTSPRWWGWNSFEGVSLSEACDYANVYDISAQKDFAFPWPHARCTDRVSSVSQVRQFQANPFGLHDLIGNLWEWTEDCFTASYKNRPRDTRAWVWGGGCETRVMRGGSWATRPLQSRAANRGHQSPAYMSSDVGFRVVRSVSPGEFASDD